jgi:hypothetical protein
MPAIERLLRRKAVAMSVSRCVSPGCGLLQAKSRKTERIWKNQLHKAGGMGSNPPASCGLPGRGLINRE